MLTIFYKICRAWRSLNKPAFLTGLEAAKPTNAFLSSKLTEPRANKQGKQVRIFRNFKLLIFVEITQLLMS
ncbi:MAG: hypothetical protein ACJA1D_001657 [Polaribacter sp.]